jgi:uroporphyrinogen decarboxylase
MEFLNYSKNKKKKEIITEFDLKKEGSMLTKFSQSILQRDYPLGMPIGVYSGLEIIHASVREVVSDAQVQTEAVLAMQERFHSEVMMTAMDLSAEAETFGCQVRMSDEEIPAVLGRLVTNMEQVITLRVPQAGELRTAVHLRTAENLAASRKAPVFGGCIGPFSLAGRLFGVSEALEATMLDPDLMQMLVEKTTHYLIEYILAFRQVGAAGVIMAEPAAGLLSPRGLAKYSASCVKQIVEETQTPDFTIILHNCGARLVHLPKVLESGAEIYHFSTPMDIPQALQQVDEHIILSGNLDPVAVFFQGTEDDVRQKTLELVETAKSHRNFIISSGCDIPPGVPLRNLEVFYSTIASH